MFDLVGPLNLRQRYRRYKRRCIGYDWFYMSFRQWYSANGKAKDGEYGYA